MTVLGGRGKTGTGRVVHSVPRRFWRKEHSADKCRWELSAMSHTITDGLATNSNLSVGVMPEGHVPR